MRRFERRKGFAERLPIGTRDSRRCGGRGRAQVGHEVGDGEVGLVAHAAHHGNRAGVDRARDDLLVEGPQVLEAAAAATDDEHVRVLALAGDANRARDLRAGSLALHRRGVEDHGRHRRAPAQHREDVAERRRLTRGHDADRAREGRQRPLAVGIEQAIGRELRLELLERLVQRATARAAQLVDGELVGAARLVERHACAQLHPQAVLRAKVEELRARAIHHAIDRGRLVLQAEVPVARCRRLHVGELARDPEHLELVLQQRAHAPVQLGHG
jgi:hypothetical protein